MSETQTDQLDEHTFDLSGWLEARTRDSNYVLVEIGHAASPIAKNQEFHGKRAYIGVEAWLNEIYATGSDQALSELKRRKGENIFFIDRPVDMRNFSEDDLTSVLPDCGASEVFLGNVLGEPRISTKHDGVKKVLAEAKRLISPEGKIVIREAVTPLFGQVSREASGLGLIVDKKITPVEVDEWQTLEKIYQPHESWVETPQPQDFYLILSKQATELTEQ